MPHQPRGIRNNNPGNIEYTGTRWQGLAAKPSDGRFCIFKGPEWGIRALCRVLITYQDKRRANDGSKIDSIQEIIDRWAPANENDTRSYAAHVSRMMRRAASDESIDVHRYEDMRGLVEAIIKHENGMQPYDEKTINHGLLLAGIQPPPPSLKESKTLKGGKVAGIGTVGIASTEILDRIQDASYTLEPFAYEIEVLKWILIALTLAGIGYAMYSRIQDNKNRIA